MQEKLMEKREFNRTSLCILLTKEKAESPPLLNKERVGGEVLFLFRNSGCFVEFDREEA